MLSYMTKGVIKLRILRGDGYLALFQWALNPVTIVFIRVKQREIKHTEKDQAV